MAKNADLQERVDELEAENDALREQLDTIADIVAPDSADPDGPDIDPDDEDADPDEDEDDSDPN
mgnify:CR=1 FL=1